MTEVPCCPISNFNSFLFAPVTYTIINSVGKEIIKKEINPTAGNHLEKISLDEYASGIYYVIMQSGDHIINKKLVIQK